MIVVKKKILITIIAFILLTTGCQKNDIKNLEKNLTNMDLTGDLITEKVYYHNVADYDKKAEDGIFHIFDQDRKLWVEYTGTVELGIDLTKVKVTPKGDKIHVFIPKTKILNPNVEKKESKDIVFYDNKEGWFNSNKLTMEDSTEAMNFAQKSMVETVQKDTQLLRISQIRAKYLIEERIKQFGKVSEELYTIEWEYEEN